MIPTVSSWRPRWERFWDQHYAYPVFLAISSCDGGEYVHLISVFQSGVQSIRQMSVVASIYQERNLTLHLFRLWIEEYAPQFIALFQAKLLKKILQRDRIEIQL